MDHINRGNMRSNILFLEKTGLLSFDKNILEIGSGKGLLVKILKEKGYDIMGTEVNPEYIEFAKKEFGINLVQIESGELNFVDSSFDFIISFDVFEHIKDTDAHLNDVYRMLKPGGYYLLCTPNKITNIPFEIIKERSFTKWKTYHCALHTYSGIQKRFAENNFSINFIDVPLVNEYFKEKIKKYLGKFGLLLIKIINPDKLPSFLKTNFYIVGNKK